MGDGLAHWLHLDLLAGVHSRRLLWREVVNALHYVDIRWIGYVQFLIEHIRSSGLYLLKITHEGKFGVFFTLSESATREIRYSYLSQKYTR